MTNHVFLSIVVSFAASVAYMTFRRSMSPFSAAITSVVVLVGAPFGGAIVDRWPLFGAAWGLGVAIVSDLSTSRFGNKKK